MSTNVVLTPKVAATAATLVDLAKRSLPPHITEAEQVEAYLALKRIAAEAGGGAVEAIRAIQAAAVKVERETGEMLHPDVLDALDTAMDTFGGQ